MFCFRRLPAIYGCLMILIITCLFTRGFRDLYTNLLDHLYSFDYLRTYVEIYFLIIFNSVLFLSFLILPCRSKKSLQRILIGFQLFIYGYILIKFLIFYEWTDWKNLDRFDYLILIFSSLFAIIGIFIWQISFNFKYPNSFAINEQTPLLNSENNEDINVKIKQTSGSWWRILKLGKKEWKLYICGFVFLLIAAFSDMFQPLFSGQIISSVVNRNWKDFLLNIFWYLGISFVYVITSGLRGFVFSITSTNLIQRLRNILFHSILKQDMEFFDQTKTGEITSRLSSDVTTVGEAVSVNFNIFLRSAVQMIGMIIMMMILSWNLFILTLITGPLAFGTSKIYGNLISKQQKKVQDALAESNSLAEEALSTIRTVKSFANEDEEIRLFMKKNDFVRQLSIRQAFYYFGYMWNGQILIVLLNLGTLAYGGHLVMSNRLDVSNFVSFILYQQRLGSLVDSMNDVSTGLMKASGASVKLFEYIDRIPKIVNKGTIKTENFQGLIEFKNVSFAFPNRKDMKVLKNISFIVQPGQQVALVGPSGSGKTTCIALLEHFYEPDEGEILIDNIPVQNYDYKFYHEKISLVSQEPVLHARSIRDNIQYGLIEMKSSEEIERIALIANAHLFISQFPNSYETECGERGVQMAGGQKQRIALARALIRSPRVLLLDEATSALDAEAESQVQEAISRTVIGRTVLVIAHRLSTVRNADRILVLQYGTIVEDGTHHDLMSRHGLYYQLVKRQTEQIDCVQTIHSIESTNQTTISIGIPLTEKNIYSTSFNCKESI